MNQETPSTKNDDTLYLYTYYFLPEKYFWEKVVDLIEKFEKGDDSFYFKTYRAVFLHWLGSLRALFEGFEKLKLKDAKIEQLATAEHIASLQLARNYAFHFQKRTASHKLETFIKNDRVMWAHKLHFEFERFLVEYIKTLSASQK